MYINSDIADDVGAKTHFLFSVDQKRTYLFPPFFARKLLQVGSVDEAGQDKDAPADSGDKEDDVR